MGGTNGTAGASAAESTAPNGWTGVRSLIVEALAIGVASRMFAIGALMAAFLGRLPPPLAPVASPFMIFDSQWYARIATAGYHAQAVLATPYGLGYHDFAFFPAWPAVLALVSLGGRLPIEIVGPVLANLFFVLACIPILKLLRMIAPPEVARAGLALFAFAPGAYVFSLPYTESMFVLAAAAALIAQSTRAVGAFAAVAQLTRVMGVAIVAAALPDLFHEDRRLRASAAIVASGVALVGWFAFIAVLTGDPTGYLQGTPAWLATQTPEGLPTGIASLLTSSNQGAAFIAAILVALLGVGAIALVRLGHSGLALFSATCLAGTLFDTWDTMPRIVGIAFPAFVGLASVLPTPRVRWLLVGAFGAAQAVLAAFAVGSFLTP